MDIEGEAACYDVLIVTLRSRLSVDKPSCEPLPLPLAILLSILNDLIFIFEVLLADVSDTLI